MQKSTTSSKKGKNAKPKIIKITPEQLHQLTEAIRASNLDPKIGEMLIDNISGNQWLVVALEKGQMSIKKLRALFNITTESSINRKNCKPDSDTTIDDSESATEQPEGSSDNLGDDSASKPKKRKGHGRIKASAYEGAEMVEVLHPDLTRGGPCPEEFCDGKLYELSEPGIMLHDYWLSFSKSNSLSAPKIALLGL